MRLRSIFILSLTLICATMSVAQKDIKKADKLLSLKAFELAIKQYESIVANDPENARCYAQLAEAYRMSSQPLEALKAYEKAFQLSDDLDKEYVLNYAHTLKKIGLYAQAESWYAVYSEVDPAISDHFINSTEYAKSLLQEKNTYDVLAFDGNSEESDFGVSFFKDNIVFASFRDDMTRENDKKNDSYISQKGNQLYKAPRSGFISSENIKFLRPDYKEIYGLAPLSYSKDNRMVAFMRNNFSQISNYIFSDEANMSIYFAFTNEDGDFSDAKPFPYNQVSYSYAFPSLGFNGSALYFSSNRPGGYGGFDIYVSYLKNGNWSAPENLGPSINSIGNEITPSYDGDNLYFASDYRMGLGGYDIFQSVVSDGKWSEAKNMGKGINSPSDDYYLAKNDRDGSYYFTSNRLGGRGKDDIYIAYTIADQHLDELAQVVPSALDLNSLAKSSEGGYGTLKDETSEAAMVAVSAKETVLIMDEESSFDFEGATRELSFDNEYNPEVFFIQLASLTRSEGLVGEYQTLSSFGNLYRFFKQDAVKIRLGFFPSREDAESILPQVKRAGFSDAFITADVLTSSQFEMINANSLRSTAGFVDDFNAGSQYKVKLASYTDPLKFNVDGIKDVGRLEQWTKGKWTIFVIGGFTSLDDAKRARIKAINRGWADAELVVDEGGILRKINNK